MLNEQTLFPELYSDEFWDGIEGDDVDGNPAWFPCEELPGTPMKLIPSCTGFGGGRWVPDYDKIPD